MEFIGAVSEAVEFGQGFIDAVHRSCTIKIENGSSVYSFAHPKVWMHSGETKQRPAPTVDVKATAECAFSKTAGAARGAVGVLTYELLKSNSSSNKLLAIMFSVPYDYNLYKNWMAVGIFDKTQKCDRTLYDLMYYDSDSRFERAKATEPSIVYTWESMEIRANMSNEGTAVVGVEIHDKN